MATRRSRSLPYLINTRKSSTLLWSHVTLYVCNFFKHLQLIWVWVHDRNRSYFPQWEEQCLPDFVAWWRLFHFKARLWSRTIIYTETFILSRDDHLHYYREQFERRSSTGRYQGWRTFWLWNLHASISGKCSRILGILPAEKAGGHIG